MISYLLLTNVNAALPDIDYCHNRYPLLLRNVCISSKQLLGPKVNTVEKLGELRRAGVNIGMYSPLPIFSVFSPLGSPYELLSWIT